MGVVYGCVDVRTSVSGGYAYVCIRVHIYVEAWVNIEGLSQLFATFFFFPEVGCLVERGAHL